MSTLTAAGRRQIRDRRLDSISRRLRQDAVLANLPAHQRDALCELRLVGKDLYSDIARRGVILPDGEVNPAVEAHRKNCHEQLYSLSVYLGLKQLQSSESRDLVAAMAQAIEAPAPAAGPEEPVADGESRVDSSKRAVNGVETSAAASDEQAAFDFAASADGPDGLDLLGKL